MVLRIAAKQQTVLGTVFLASGEPTASAVDDTRRSHGRRSSRLRRARQRRHSRAMAHNETTEHVVKTRRHTTFYLASGREQGTPIIFLHGWPELSISWRHQLPVFAALGFRCLAPDMRGYGRSSTYTTHAAFAQREIVADMLELADALKIERA